MSSTADGASADLQQTVADLQRQLAEARAERDEFEAQKAALAEVLGIINSSPGDLTPVFDAILEKAHRICGADWVVWRSTRESNFVLSRPMTMRRSTQRWFVSRTVQKLACMRGW